MANKSVRLFDVGETSNLLVLKKYIHHQQFVADRPYPRWVVRTAGVMFYVSVVVFLLAAGVLFLPNPH